MRIAFHTNQLGLGGTEVALYDYADYNEKLLDNESIIISNKKHPSNNADVIAKFSTRFKNIILYENKNEINNILEKEKTDIFYAIKEGGDDGIKTNVCKTAVHVVFKINAPHGDVYFYVSEWLSKAASNGLYPFVPHMITLPPTNENYRNHFSIPEDAIVFGRYGSYDTFDIEYAKNAVREISKNHRDIYFLFMNTEKFMDGKKNVIFLKGSSDVHIKAAFINSCNAMLHARDRGETFGIAVGEFSSRNKPVITYANSPERAHIEILGGSAMLYNNYKELYETLINFRDIYDKKKNYDLFSKNYSPEAVMQKFREVVTGEKII
jgi:hypothetical protein